MNRMLNLKNERPWLSKVHQQKKERSIILGKKTIDTLIDEGTPITLKNIEKKSKLLDPTEKGIHPNTIKTNTELYDYYKMHSITYKVKNRKAKTVVIKFDESDLRKISPDRNIPNVRTKYMKLSKHELVERIIKIEEFMANNQKKWVSKYFEQFT